ncbi:MAG TPA: ATP-binding protein [Longimicrobiales bacterium]|nr:ATP-binding protein [Longimicrobiales bacterium]
MRLSTRLLLPLLTTVALVMGIYTAWSIKQREATLAIEAQRETEALATALGLALEYAFRDRKLADVQDIIDRVSLQPKVYGALVYGPKGDILFVSDPLRATGLTPPRDLGEVFRVGRTIGFERRLAGQHVYSVLRPIRNPKGKIVGAFEVAQPLSFLEAERTATRNRFLLNTLTLLAAITVVILVLVRRLIGAPLRGFVRAVRALGRGELGYRIDEGRGGGELRELASEFNRMAVGLETARAELVREAEERIALERRLRETEKLAAVGNLAASLAHEIAAPLNVVSGRAELLLKREAAPEVRERNLRIIVEQIGRITTIIRNLLDFSRRREPRIRPVDLASVLEGVTELLEGELARAGVQLVREGPESAWIRGDAHLLHQVFLNLMLNALQAMGERDGERRIVIRLATAAGGNGMPLWVTAEVRDTGPGIPPHALPRVFEPFFTTKAGGQGTGLGLAVALSIVEEHGGELEAENAFGADGRVTGAVFRVRLPAASAPEYAHA